MRIKLEFLVKIAFNNSIQSILRFFFILLQRAPRHHPDQRDNPLAVKNEARLFGKGYPFIPMVADVGPDHCLLCQLEERIYPLFGDVIIAQTKIGVCGVIDPLFWRNHIQPLRSLSLE